MASKRRFVGRKRKTGERHPSGDLVRDALEDRRGPAQVKRMMDHMLKTSRDPALGTPLGRLFLEGFISPAEYNAGIKFAFLRAKADRAMGVPARNPRALDYDHGINGRSVALDNPEYELALVAALDEVEAAIGPHSPALIAVYNVAIYDELPSGYAEKLACKAGLDKAVKHWKLES